MFTLRAKIVLFALNLIWHSDAVQMSKLVSRLFVAGLEDKKISRTENFRLHHSLARWPSRLNHFDSNWTEADWSRGLNDLARLFSSLVSDHRCAGGN